MSPHVPGAQGAISRHTVSPGTAMSPGGHGASGKMRSQPRSPSCTKPSPQPSGGTPAGMHTPSSRSHSAGGHGMSGGSPGGTQLPSSRGHSAGAQPPGGESGGGSSPSPPQPATSTKSMRASARTKRLGYAR